MNATSLCFIVTGDLAFFYDMNALGIRHIRSNVRILLINNKGGAEFKVMTQHWKEAVSTDKYISACGHNGSAKGWAQNCGFDYFSVSNEEELKQVKGFFLSESVHPILLEVFTEGEEEKRSIEFMLTRNRIKNYEDKLKHLVSSIVGQQGLLAIKKIVGNDDNE